MSSLTLVGFTVANVSTPHNHVVVVQRANEVGVGKNRSALKISPGDPAALVRDLPFEFRSIIVFFTDKNDAEDLVDGYSERN